MPCCNSLFDKVVAVSHKPLISWGFYLLEKCLPKVLVDLQPKEAAACFLSCVISDTFSLDYQSKWKIK